MDLIDRRLRLLAELRQLEAEIEQACELEAVNELSPPNVYVPSSDPYAPIVRVRRDVCN